MRTSKPRTIDLSNAAAELLGDCGRGAAPSDLGTTVDVGEHRTLSRAGATSPQFVVVTAGQVVVERCGAPPVTLIAGAWFGHEALLARRPLSDLTATTATAARLWVLSRREFASLLERFPAVRERLECRQVGWVDASPRWSAEPPLDAPVPVRRATGAMRR